MISPSAQTLTIGKLAKAAGVGVETIRYYQLRNLLPVPLTSGASRHYSASLSKRIRFIKRAQDLGCSLEEVSELLSLEDGLDRTTIRKIANERLEQIEIKLNDLSQMKKALFHLAHECENTVKEFPCPIFATLTEDVGSITH